jgi:hypothetical protein
MSFIKLAKFEKEQATCTSQKIRAADISNFANAVVRVSRSQTKLNAEIAKHLVSGVAWVKEYSLKHFMTIHCFLPIDFDIFYAFTGHYP